MKPDRIQLTATPSPWATIHVGEYVFATFADAARFVGVITGVIAGQSVSDIEISIRGNRVKVTIGPLPHQSPPSSLDTGNPGLYRTEQC